MESNPFWNWNQSIPALFRFRKDAHLFSYWTALLHCCCSITVRYWTGVRIMDAHEEDTIKLVNT